MYMYLFSYILITYIAITCKYYYPNNILSVIKLMYYTVALTCVQGYFYVGKIRPYNFFNCTI